MDLESGRSVSASTSGMEPRGVELSDSHIMTASDVSVGFGATTVMTDITVGFHKGSINALDRTLRIRKVDVSALAQPDERQGA